jgi:hypothetical protein
MRFQISVGPEVLSTGIVTLEINDFQTQVREVQSEARRSDGVKASFDQQSQLNSTQTHSRPRTTVPQELGTGEGKNNGTR